MTLELNKIYNMDCIDGMKMLDDNCIDLTVTSPPYDNLRKYNGFGWDFEGVAKGIVSSYQSWWSSGLGSWRCNGKGKRNRNIIQAGIVFHGYKL